MYEILCVSEQRLSANLCKLTIRGEGGLQRNVVILSTSEVKGRGYHESSVLNQKHND